VRPRTFDVIVAGGGPAGSATAIALARAGRRVLLADPSPARPAALKIGETLPAVAATVLRDLGLHERIEDACVAIRSSGTSAAWGGEQPLVQEAIVDPHGHGWHLDRARFDGWLREQARSAGAKLCEGTVAASRTADGVQEPPAVRVQLGEQGTLAPVACRWVVDATGRRAAIARGQGARRQRRDRLVALYAPMRTPADDVDARTRVEATPAGWWYSALVGSGRRVVAFLTDADLVEPAWRTRSGFRAALDATRHVLPSWPATLASDPATTAAHGSRLMPAAGAGWLAVGDAALAFDPLSSQGILNALITGLQAAAAVDARLRGDGAAIGAYERRLAGVWSAYELNRARAYALERRWPGAEFWARRAEGVQAGPVRSQTGSSPGGGS
jgi:flavin-dependent dehydrogenase